MDFMKEDNQIYLTNQEGKTIAGVHFPEVGANLVNINHTFVDPSLRGQGIAGKLMEEVVKYLRENNKKARLTCSYAVRWFEEHSEYSDLVAKN